MQAVRCESSLTVSAKALLEFHLTADKTEKKKRRKEKEKTSAIN
jgi:hypothetical protein